MTEVQEGLVNAYDHLGAPHPPPKPWAHLLSRVRGAVMTSVQMAES